MCTAVAVLMGLAMSVPAAASAQTADFQKGSVKAAVPGGASVESVSSGAKTPKYVGTARSKQVVTVVNNGASLDKLTFRAGSSGYVDLSAAPYGGYVQLYRGGTAVSSRTYISNSLGTVPNWMMGTYFGVQKGKTYTVNMLPTYVPTQTEGDYAGQKVYAFTYINHKVYEKSGTRKSKARAIRIKKLRKGYIAAGSKEADWYKITTRKKGIRIYFNGGTNNKLKAEITHRNGRHVIKGTLYLTRSKGQYAKLPKKSYAKGTYYIKVTRTKGSSGVYTLRWK
ncbi:MAG: hypothetical protein ACOX4I_01945 [Anaerovoracaceae bacterium]